MESSATPHATSLPLVSRVLMELVVGVWSDRKSPRCIALQTLGLLFSINLLPSIGKFCSRSSPSLPTSRLSAASNYQAASDMQIDASISAASSSILQRLAICSCMFSSKHSESCCVNKGKVKSYNSYWPLSECTGDWLALGVCPGFPHRILAMFSLLPSFRVGVIGR